MLTGAHFILTYVCNFECDHCFLYCSPRSKGVYTLKQFTDAIEEIKKIPSVETICFEGGEAFLFYPLLLEGVRIASRNNFNTAIETNSYWATTESDAKLWLEPLVKAGLSMLEVSDDTFHYGEEIQNSAKKAYAAAKELGLKVNTLKICKPEIGESNQNEKGEPIYLGGPKLRGRAVEKLATDLPKRPIKYFTECPFEDLENPKRVHIDPFGNVHLCQGISMGNMHEIPLSELISNYDPYNHPIAGPLIKGGPARLAEEHNAFMEEEFADACHLCSHVCKSLIGKYPEYLAPKQVYGFE